MSALVPRFPPSITNPDPSLPFGGEPPTGLTLVERNTRALTAPGDLVVPLSRAALSTGERLKKAISYVQPSTFDMLSGASPASAMDGCAE